MVYSFNKVYIVFDGTSHYAIWGCALENEIEENDIEVVRGLFNDWDDYVDNLVEKFNNEASGRKYDKRYF